jgi:predicted transcriptional regulator
MATVNVELSESAYEKLNAMALARQVGPSEILEDLLNQPFFELSDAQMQEVDRAIEALDRGDVATEHEAKAFFAQYAR